MKTYPSIDAAIRDGKYYVFDKLYGSNIRVEPSKSNSFINLEHDTDFLNQMKSLLGYVARKKASAILLKKNE